MFDVIVIGGGPAGVTAALRAQELGATVALVERGRMGGTCTNDGCVPTRVLAKAARLLRDTEQFGEYGLIGLPPQLDFARLLTRTQQVVYGIHEKKQLIGHLQHAGVAVYSEVGSARFEDPHTIRIENGLELSSEKFILCAGGRARRIDFPGAEHTLTHSDVWSMKTLPASLIIVGAAATGCQLASIFAGFGVKVWLLEVAPRILQVEDECITEIIQSAFQQRGIQTITGIDGIDWVEKQSDGLILQYRISGEATEITADAILMSTGWIGNLSSLNLSAVGVQTVGQYIKVNEQFCTTAAHIFAAGDITGKMMLVQSAGYEALAAAENAVLGSCQTKEHSIVPHGGFTDPEYGSVGITEAQAREQADCVISQVSYADIDRAVIDGHPEGLCKLIVSKETRQILGAHVVGEQALEVVEVAAAGMAAGMTVEQLANLEIAYPTFTAVLGLAARKIVREMNASQLSPEWRSLGMVIGVEWERRD